MRTAALVVALSLAAVGTALAGFVLAGATDAKASASSPGSRLDVTHVAVTAEEFDFKLDKTTVPAGTVEFDVTNIGDVIHNFAIAGQVTPDIQPHGGTATLTVTFSRAGEYGYSCTIGEHAELGMQGTLTVTGSATTTSSTTTTGSTTGSTTTAPTTTATPPTWNVNVSETEFKIQLSGTALKVVKKYKTVRYRTLVKKRVKVNGKWVTKTVPVMKTKKVLVSTTQTIPAGVVRFHITNRGKLGHNFVIAQNQSLVLAPGKSQTLEVELTKGTYKYDCSIQGHAAAGMKGSLTVV